MRSSFFIQTHGSYLIKMDLADHTRLKSHNCRLRAEASIEKMIRHSIPINFQSVSRYASVAKSWLYKQRDLADKIKKLRCASGTIKKSTSNLKALSQKNKKIKILSIQVSILKKQNQGLKAQIEKLYGQLLQ